LLVRPHHLTLHTLGRDLGSARATARIGRNW
jgi:hypothetical protein